MGLKGRASTSPFYEYPDAYVGEGTFLLRTGLESLPFSSEEASFTSSMVSSGCGKPSRLFDFLQPFSSTDVPDLLPLGFRFVPGSHNVNRKLPITTVLRFQQVAKKLTDFSRI